MVRFGSSDKGIRCDECGEDEAMYYPTQGQYMCANCYELLQTEWDEALDMEVEDE